MTKLKNKVLDLDKNLSSSNSSNTNQLFLELLCNMKKYPHITCAKNQIRQGGDTFDKESLYNFEEFNK